MGARQRLARRRGGLVAALLIGAGVTSAGVASAETPLAEPPIARPSAETTLPPVPLEALRPRAAPQPQWDVGLLAGLCVQGRSQPWEATYFCGDAVLDVTWLRRRAPDRGLGLFAGVGTRGFEDGRYSLGALGLTPLGELLLAQLELGGLAVSDAAGVSPGLLARLGVGFRALNQTGHYGHSHQLALALAHVPGDEPRAGTTLVVQLRVDAFWLLMPFGRL